MTEPIKYVFDCRSLPSEENKSIIYIDFISIISRCKMEAGAAGCVQKINLQVTTLLQYLSAQRNTIETGSDQTVGYT